MAASQHARRRGFDGAVRSGGRRLTFAGVGNVAGVLVVNGELKRMVSMPGTAGHNARKIQSFEYPFESGLVILHSDGLSTSWTLGGIPICRLFIRP